MFHISPRCQVGWCWAADGGVCRFIVCWQAVINTQWSHTFCVCLQTCDSDGVALMSACVCLRVSPHVWYHISAQNRPYSSRLPEKMNPCVFVLSVQLIYCKFSQLNTNFLFGFMTLSVEPSFSCNLHSTRRFNPKINQKNTFPIICSVIYPSRWLWCELQNGSRKQWNWISLQGSETCLKKNSIKLLHHRMSH